MVKPTQHLFLDLPKVGFPHWGDWGGDRTPPGTASHPGVLPTAGGAAGTVAGALLDHRGLDSQRSLHHSLLDPGWAQAPLYHP